MKKKTCIIIAGPTAVGKTTAAIELANYYSTEIISADSRQCYKELNIGVAKPSQDELISVRHYFIDSHSIHDSINAADFEKYALDAVEKIFSKSDIAVMVGGTGLYIKAFCEGLDQIPAVNPDIRNLVVAQYNLLGMEWLTKELKDKDPIYCKVGEMQNPRRMMRALEVMLSSGHSIVNYQSHHSVNRDFNIVKIGIELPRDILYERINKRVDEMIDKGLVSEAEKLLSFKSLNALQTVGYKELFDCFDGKITEKRAIELIKQNTRHYAKRQMTWFKKDTAFNWVRPDVSSIKTYIDQSVHF
jgi:tRNA dimethylallyltransferase